MRRPSMVRTTGLVIVVSGLNVRDVELGVSDDCDGVGVIEGEGECEDGGDSVLDEVVT